MENVAEIQEAASSRRNRSETQEVTVKFVQTYCSMLLEGIPKAIYTLARSNTQATTESSCNRI